MPNLISGANSINVNIPNELPSQSGQSGKYLTTNGTSVSWATVSDGVLPTYASNPNKRLRTDSTAGSGTGLEWVDDKLTQLHDTPATYGTSGQVLQTDGTSALTWSTPVSLKFALQGAILSTTVGTSFVIPLSSVADASSSSYPKLNLASYDPDSMLSNNVITIQSSGWYQINIFIHHTINGIDGTGAQEGLGESEFRIRFNGATTDYGEFMNSTDSEPGASETVSYTAIVNLSTNDYFDVVMTNTTAQTNEDLIVRMGIIKLT